ncbi:hypothetical protein TGAM01_v205992 [Trichoderma gamsii]|uniref:Myb-like domain-containing protein n=1 Tax=Trichoderma gamsii TaxID=398673 RepID=A0A2P4ZLY3_9HYPO|nr:hypothetical protein TGAM01_v205992 [Trichoderma gamsii]PON25306.1 hypothetical protein TGAM01_v205992 [Trichoderma gamsii]
MAATLPSGNQRMTRGGRAWSEQEDAFLMQTRENKMPYKQIAHQLKKTELACRLHFHQLVRNSARGRRNRGSVSSMSDLSPEMDAAASASTFRRRRAPHRRADSESSMSTTSSREYYLPRITESSADSARQHIILPRPAAMPDDTAYTSRASWRPHSVAEEFAPLHDQHYQHYHHRTPSLPPQREMMPLPLPSTAAEMPAHVDLPRLHAIYDAHRGAFWNHIASEYGYNTPPEMLEDAWKAGVYGGVHQYPCPSFNRPMTPVSSPEAERRHHGVDRTRISSIISGDDDADRR